MPTALRLLRVAAIASFNYSLLLEYYYYYYYYY